MKKGAAVLARRTAAIFRGTPKSEVEFHPAVEPPRTRFIAEGQFGKLQIDAGIGLGDVDRLREHFEIIGDLVADLAVELTIGFLIDAQGPRRRPVGETEIRSEEHTSELQSLMRISYAVF